MEIEARTADGDSVRGIFVALSGDTASVDVTAEVARLALERSAPDGLRPGASQRALFPADPCSWLPLETVEAIVDADLTASVVEGSLACQYLAVDASSQFVLRIDGLEMAEGQTLDPDNAGALEVVAVDASALALEVGTALLAALT
ncbi:MAG: hypothetical protein ACI8Y4_005502 [Candidatus Poriferisodalaceae bacterium]